MRLAISNLAWERGEDKEVAGLLTALGVDGVELAPTKVWPDPLAASNADIEACRQFWNENGIRIVALQSLLFGRPDLMIFDSATAREATLAHLAGHSQLAARLGAQVLVFGSPKNRTIGSLPRDEVDAIAHEFFTRLASIADGLGVCVCIEPNPSQYQCNFVTSGAQGVRLVEQINRRGFGLHLDTGALTLARDDYSEIIADYVHMIRHFHVSEPFLRPICPGDVPHAAIAAALRNATYEGWISIEMKSNGVSAMAAIERSIRFVQDCYLRM